MLVELIFEKRNDKKEYNLLTNFDEANIEKYAQLKTLSYNIFDENYPLEVTRIDNKNFMLEIDENVDHTYINNKLVKPTKFLKTIVKNLTDEELFVEADNSINGESKENILIKYFINDNSLPENYFDKVKASKYVYEISQNIKIYERSADYHKTIVFSNNLYTQEELFEILIKYHNEDWADFDKNGLINYQGFYKKPEKRKIEIEKIDLNKARTLVNKMFDKSQNPYQSEIKIDAINIDNKNQVTQIKDIQSIFYFDRFNSYKVAEYIYFLIFSEIKNRNLADKFKDYLLMKQFQFR